MENSIMTWLDSAMTTVIIPFIFKLVGILIIWFVGSKVIKLTRKLFKRILAKADAEQGVITFLDNFVKYALYALLIVAILGKFGVETTSIAAAVASCGVAVGLALQGSLSNLAGGVLLLLLKPFKVGDYIVSSGLEGTVTEIQMFYTRLKTADNKVCVIPNGTLSNGTITNVTANDKRRVDIKVGIAYNSDLKLAKAVLLDMIKNCPYVLQEEANDVFVSELGASSVVLNVRAWTKTSDFWTTSAYINENSKLVLDANNIEIPFNQLDVHLYK